MHDEQKPVVKVCGHANCAARHARDIFERLRVELHDEALVRLTDHCLDHCTDGPNASVNGVLVSGLTPESAVGLVRKELTRPSQKSDGAGTRSLDDLDAVLDDVTQFR